MSAPPPQPPPSAVDNYYYDDDGFDWEAAVLEMDKVCALKAASSSAPDPAPAPVQQPAPPRPPEPSATAPVRKPSAAPGAGVGQSTLDRFINPSTSVQREMPAPAPAAVPAGGGGHPGLRAGEGCSRQAGKNGLEDRFMASFSLRREQEKAAPAPAAAPEPAPAQGRPGVFARKGCWRQAGEDIVYDPCAVALNHEAVQTWIYPTNVQIRKYQKDMVEKALFTNTLVALPTGLGKTFIAAVVMYNYFRWFPEGKIVFTAPSRPLVTQQIEACHNTVGIPQEWAVEMKGSDSPSKRSILWKSKRVFFVTPQVLDNDIRSGICMIKQIVCLVIDEAHKASGNHAYCGAVQKLVEAHVPLRILALTATPGSKHADIQSVINNLCISELVHFDEEDSEVRKYINTRDVEVRKIPLGSDATEVDNLLLDIMHPHLNRLRDAGVIDYRDSAKWNAYDLLCYKNKFAEAPPPHIHEVDRDNIAKSFVALCSLCHIRKLLVSHGIKQAYEFIVDKLKKRALNLMCKNELFWQLKEKMQLLSSQGSGVKIKELRTVMVEHFNKSDSKDSRVIIFSHFRGSVNEIYCSLQTIDNNLVRPIEFIGQSSAGKRLKGQSQKTQQAILQKFRSGEYNVLVATSIGEEGLDIIEVDLVVCFDANISPLRMIQRMGRTGRKHDGRVVVLACEGDEAKGYEKKQVDTKTMKKLLRSSKRFEYHASPRMIPHLFKPEVEYVQLTIEKYIPSLKKIKVAVKGASPVLKMSEEDGQLIARYFGTDQDVWRPSLVAFPRFQLSPSVIHKVPHSFRTTDMLIDAMQQLQDLSFFRTKCENPLQEPADAATVKGQAHEEAMPQGCDSMEASSKEVLNQSVFVPSSKVKTYPIHTFFSGDHVTVDSGGNVSVTFVPVLPHAFVFHKDIKNADWCRRVLRMSRPCKLGAEVSSPTVEFDRPRYVTDSGKHMLQNSISNLPLHSHSGQAGNVNDRVLATPSKTLTSPREEWDPYCSARLASSSLSGQDDVELSPRLLHYIEEGIVPESPLLDGSHRQVELDGAVNDQDSAGGCQKEPSEDEKNDHVVSSRHNILDQTRVQAEESACPSNVKICTPTNNTSTNVLCDSFSSDCHLRSGADTSGSVQQAPKYRRLCKYGDKIKRVSISLDGCHDGFRDITTIPNQIEHTTGNKAKAKRHPDTYIDDEVEVSQDADVSEDEDDNLSEDKYEDSFIDDQETPTGEFTQTEQGDGNNADMMGFYRQSLLTQTPVVLPSRYLDASDGSAFSRTRNTSSSETGHNSVERVKTPKGPPPIHHTMDASPLWYRQRSMEGASITQQQSETTNGNCELSSKMDCRKRKLSFQQPSSIPVINLEPEPALQPSSHLATGASGDIYLDDDFFEGLDLDAIEAQATEQWKQRTAQSTQEPVEPKKASEISFAPPSFDLGF